MPCNMVATVRSQVSLDPKLITHDAAGLKAAQTVIASALSLQASAVTVNRRPQYAEFSTAVCNVRLYLDGYLEVLTSSDDTRRRVELAVNATLGLLNSLKVKRVIAERFGVENIVEEQRLADGALVMEVNL